jgi:glycosyltransferase involved in cell wall biosynthesis
MITSDKNLPVVSYIMPVFNRAKVVGPALAAVIEERRCNYPNIEIVVMDGGSTDGTVDIVKSFGEEVQVLRSEKDGGAADAFNKGIKLAQGELIRYVAGDDNILIGHTRRMVDHLMEHPEIDLLGARARSLRMNTSGVAVENEKHAALNGGWMTPEEVLTWDRSGVFAYIETWFFRRRIFEKIGYLDTRYRICPDIDFAFRAVNADCKFFVLPDIVVNKIDYADGSNLVANVPETFAEFRQIVAAHGTLRQRLMFFYSFPTSLHDRIFWGAWLWLVKQFKSLSPKAYAKAQSLIGR